MTDIPDIQAKLITLKKRQCEVLYWVCHGYLYKEIGKGYGKDEETIQKDMSHVYKTLGLDHLKSQYERRAVLFETICPIHADLVKNPDTGCEQRVIPRIEPEVEPEILTLVKQDWGMLMLPNRTEIIPTQESEVLDHYYGAPPPRRQSPLPWILVGVLVTLLVVALSGLAYFIFGGPLPRPGAPNTPIVVTQPPLVITQAPIVITQPPVIITQAPVVVTQPPIVITQPPPTPTRALPTATPSITPNPNTASGTILDVGQSWRTDNIVLTLGEVQFYPSPDWNFCYVSLRFRIENMTSVDRTITVRESQFSVADNLGRKNIPLSISAGMHPCPPPDQQPFSQLIKSGESFPREGYWYVGISADITKSSLQYLVVTVNDLSSINAATWKVPIYH